MNRIGLALSGGGFRASLYHLGLLRFLRDAGALPKVTHITSVSGGSVLAAHLVLNWERYNGSAGEFDAAAAELLAFVRMDVRNRIIRRYPLALAACGPRRLLGRSNRKFTRTGWLEFHYQNYLYGDTSLFQLPESPQLHLLATNLSEGCLCSFTRDGIITVRRDAQKNLRLERVPPGLTTVAMAVTASSAFPGFFPPMELTGADVGATCGEFDRQAYTDGAVFDNLGVRMFRVLERPLLADCPIDRGDFHDFPAVFEALRQASVGGPETPLRRITQLLTAGARPTDLPQLTNGSAAANGNPPAPPPPAATSAAGEEWLLGRLCHLLRHYQLDRDPLFAALAPADPAAAAALKGRGLNGKPLAGDDQLWLNRHLLEAAFREATGKPCFRRLNSALDGVLVSDVGKSFEVQSAGKAGGLIRTAMRASDILMDRVWQLEIETFAGTPGFLFAPITELVRPDEDPTAIHPEVQRQVSAVRTDLDRFSDLEISNLVRHGYCVGRKTCRSRPDLFGDRLPDGPPWDPSPTAHAPAAQPIAVRTGGPPLLPAPATIEARALQASAGRRIWGRLLDWRDWVSYIYVPIIVPILFLLPYFAVKAYRTNRMHSVLMQSLSQGSRDLEVMTRLLQNGPDAAWPVVPIEEVGTLEEPNHAGFDIIQDSWIMDLRKWKPDGTVKNEAGSYAFHTRRLMVTRSTDDEKNSIFRWRLLPRDPKAAFRFPPQELRPTLHKCLDQNPSPGGDRMARWEVSYDFKNVPVGQFENLIAEHEGSGFYLKDDADSTTVPLNLRADTAELTAWILMPQGKEYSSYRVTRRSRTRGTVERVNVVTEFLPKDHSILAFKLLALKGDDDYELTWTYR
jgi:predicted acylesterase/phospholipase RssA